MVVPTALLECGIVIGGGRPAFVAWDAALLGCLVWGAVECVLMRRSGSGISSLEMVCRVVMTPIGSVALDLLSWLRTERSPVEPATPPRTG